MCTCDSCASIQTWSLTMTRAPALRKQERGNQKTSRLVPGFVPFPVPHRRVLGCENNEIEYLERDDEEETGELALRCARRI
jgi:hypothetical protein